MLSLKDLKNVGFKQCASWRLRDDKSSFLQVETEIPEKPGIYLFVVDDKVRYVGKADKTLNHRVHSYESRRRGGKRARPVHVGVRDALKRGDKVTVFTLEVKEPRIIVSEGMPLDRLVGIEAGLIETIDPDWNRYNSKGRKRRIDTGPVLTISPAPRTLSKASSKASPTPTPPSSQKPRSV
jgi:hypothetical protein